MTRPARPVVSKNNTLSGKGFKRAIVYKINILARRRIASYICARMPAISITAAPPPPNPEFITLPPRGGDSVCHLSRSWWYSAESRGLITLVRVRLPGRTRGRVLLPIPQAIELIRRLASEKAS